MLKPNLLILYVKNPIESATFYEILFGCKPVAVFPTYAVFSFPNGFHLGLWSTSAKNFVSAGNGHRSELAFMVPEECEVRRLCDEWGKLGIQLDQGLMQAVFGWTFVALDPDGHRIRVCTPDK